MLKVFVDKRSGVLGADGTKAVNSLIRYREIEAKISGFLRPLGELSQSGRVHASLNLNTETGRLSCRNPNLQNEPIDDYLPVRRVIEAPPGKSLLVADYEQLELRVIAHLSNCAAMIDILAAHGDIHSRTAYKMFSDVKDAVDKNLVLLDKSCMDSGNSSLPLVRDKFPELRKRAKTLNFSLLYGKTPFTLGKEWGISTKEAQSVIDRWFDAFPEISAWKAKAEADAATVGARTILGRARPLRDLRCKDFRLKKHAERAAGNSPVQGSAADIVTLAMLQIRESEKMKALGFVQLLQVHDELLLEGPTETASEALEELRRLMEHPLPFKLRVPLPVHAVICSNWHDC